MNQSEYLSYQKSARWVSIGCSVFFLTFSFMYLYFLQGDLMEATHYSFAHGKTSYSPFWGAVLITGVLFILHRGLQALLRLKGRWIAVSYFLMMLLLGVMTDVDRMAFHGGGIPSYWCWLLPLLIVVYVLAAICLRKIEEQHPSTDLLNVLIVNGITFLLLCLMTVLIGNTEVRFHHELAVERNILKGNNVKALKIGKKSLEASRTLSVLRANAMARGGLMGEKLFEYIQSYNSDGLLFKSSTPERELLRMNADSLYHFLQAEPNEGERIMDFLKRISKIDSVHTSVKDYYLCGLLLDKRVNEFTREVKNLLPDQELPRYYKEALIWQEHQEPGFESGVNDSIMRKHFGEFLKKQEERYVSKVVEKNKMREVFGDTFWWYVTYR